MDFNEQAKEWDSKSRMERAGKIAKEVRIYISDGKQKTAMEYGCGTGLIGFQLLDELKSMLFMDASQGMINEVQQKIRTNNTNNVSALCCDLIVTPLTNLHFDYILSSMALHHIRDTETILRHFFGILNKGGSLLLVDLDKEDGSFHSAEINFNGHNGFDQTNLKELLLEVGFTNVDIHTFYYNVKVIEGRQVSYSLFISQAVK